MAHDEDTAPRDDELPFQAEGFREYVADIDPATATDMEALIVQLEHAGDEPPSEPDPQAQV